jgi:hypothetical protein
MREHDAGGAEICDAMGLEKEEPSSSRTLL